MTNDSIDELCLQADWSDSPDLFAIYDLKSVHNLVNIALDAKHPLHVRQIRNQRPEYIELLSYSQELGNFHKI